MGVSILLLLACIFMSLMCVSYAQSKGSRWQQGRLAAVCVKAILDLTLKRFIEAFVIRFAIPEMNMTDMATVREYLHKAGSRLLRKKPDYRLKVFSATDYTFVSTQLAKSMPHLLESKLVLMHRDMIPERLAQRRAGRLAQWSGQRGIYNILTLSATTALLYFGALPYNVQELVVYTIPSSL